MGIDTPSTVWDPAVGDEVATIDSQHIMESSSPTSPAKSIEEDSFQQQNMEESPSSGSPSAGDILPPVEGGEVTKDQGADTSNGNEGQSPRDGESTTTTTANNEEVASSNSPVNEVANEDNGSKIENLSSSSKEDIIASASTTSAGADGGSGAENVVDSSASATGAVTSSPAANEANESMPTNSGEASISREPSNAKENVESSTEEVVETEHSEVTQQHQIDGGKTETPQPEATDSILTTVADQAAIEDSAQPSEAETRADTKPSAET